MDQDFILKTIGDLYLRNAALGKQIQELIAERDELRRLLEKAVIKDESRS